MRILYFIDSLIAGGRERRFTELLKGVKQYPGIEFEIVVMSENIYYEDIFALNAKIHYLIRKSQYDLSVFKRFYKIAKQYKPDIIHSWASLTSVIALPTCKLLHIKLANGMVIDTPVKRNITNKYWLHAKLTFPFSDIIIGNSNAGLKAYGAPVKKSLCINNGMDFNRFKNSKDPEVLINELFGKKDHPGFIAGMVARFESRKDYNTVIEGAISLIKSNKDIYFILVGDGTELPAMMQSVPASIKNRIIFTGGRTDVESIINLFDVGILLTNTKVHGEGISNSIIEYMAMSKPVIATTGGGTNEVVKENVNGFLIEPANTVQFIERVQRLINNRHLVLELGNNGYEIANKKFNSKIITEQYISMYRQLINSN